MATLGDLAAEGLDIALHFLLACGGKEVAIGTSGATEGDVYVKTCTHFDAKLQLFR
jgi:hypothetical protein